mgnify:CR=1 FL=1
MLFAVCSVSAVCPDPSCRCSNVDVGACSLDPKLQIPCRDPPVYAVLVAGPSLFDSVIALQSAGTIGDWVRGASQSRIVYCCHLTGCAFVTQVNCSALGPLLEDALTVVGK